MFTHRGNPFLRDLNASVRESCIMYSMVRLTVRRRVFFMPFKKIPETNRAEGTGKPPHHTLFFWKRKQKQVEGYIIDHQYFGDGYFSAEYIPLQGRVLERISIGL